MEKCCSKVQYKTLLKNRALKCMEIQAAVTTTERLATHAVWFPEQVLMPLGESLLLWSRNHTLCWSCNRTGCSHYDVEPHPTESGALESYVGLRSIKMTVLFTQLFHHALLKGTERDYLTCFSFVYLFFFIG